jgi:hypothetical protein
MFYFPFFLAQKEAYHIWCVYILLHLVEYFLFLVVVMLNFGLERLILLPPELQELWACTKARPAFRFCVLKYIYWKSILISS